MKSKTLAILILAAYAIAFLPSCGTMQPETKSKWSATGGLIAKTVARAATQMVLSAATSHFDAGKKADYFDSASYGLRVNMDKIVTSEDVANFVRIWTPAKEGPSHWNDLAAFAAKSFAKNQTPGSREQVIEEIATGLQLAAASERQP